jgi:hypothetical protein
MLPKFRRWHQRRISGQHGLCPRIRGCPIILVAARRFRAYRSSSTRNDKRRPDQGRLCRRFPKEPLSVSGLGQSCHSGHLLATRLRGSRRGWRK